MYLQKSQADCFCHHKQNIFPEWCTASESKIQDYMVTAIRAINPPPAMKYQVMAVILRKFQPPPLGFTSLRYAASASTYSVTECFAADITLIRSSAWVRASDVHLQSVSRREYLITFSTVIRSCPVHYKIQTNIFLKSCVRQWDYNNVYASIGRLVILWYRCRLQTTTGNFN